MNRLKRMYEVVTKFHGIAEQVDHFYQEYDEFVKELWCFVFNTENKCITKLESEAADLINMILQVVLYWGGDLENIKKHMGSQMQRELERIDSNYYE